MYGLHKKGYQNYNAIQLHDLLMFFSIHNLESRLVVCRKKDIARHIQIVICVVLRKRCTKATKKNQYSQLVIRFSFAKQNKQNFYLYITLTSSTLDSRHCPVRFFFSTDRKKIRPLQPPGAWTDKTTHMTSNKPIKIFCWFLQPTCSLSPSHLQLKSHPLAACPPNYSWLRPPFIPVANAQYDVRMPLPFQQWRLLKVP